MIQNLNVAPNPNTSAQTSNEVSNTPANDNGNAASYNNGPDNYPAGAPNTSPRFQNSSNSTQDTFYAEKVSNIIRNWRIKYTGHNDHISVNDFI